MTSARLLVLRPGLHDTFQAPGASGWRAFGVPAGGPFDLDAHGLANALVGNPPGVPTVEMTLLGGEFEALDLLGLALAGAPMAARIERRDGGRVPLRVPQSATLGPGDRLVLGGTPREVRTYLGVKGGWGHADGRTGPFGSHCVETRLTAGSRWSAESGGIPARRPSPILLGPIADGPIRVIDGPDAPTNAIDWGPLVFRIKPQSDRLGLRLDGPPLDLPAEPDRVSAPVAPGAVQVAGGRLILLGPAGGTMGGYPHVAHVISADMGRLAQARPGGEIRFCRVSLDEARRIDREDRRRRAERLASVRMAAGDDSCGRLIGGH